MTEDSLFWADGVGDGGPYTHDQLRLLFDALAAAEDANRGVLVSQGNELDPSSTGNNNIRVATGKAVVDGTLYENDAILDIVTASPVIGTTGRRCVLQKDWAARTVRLAIISSADGTASIPALTQNDGTTWEIPICSFTITTGGVIGALTDERELAGTSPATQRRLKEATETVNNNAALQDDDELFFPMAANENWAFEAFLIFSTTAVADINFAFTVPAGASLVFGVSVTNDAVNEPTYPVIQVSGSENFVAGEGAQRAVHIMGTVAMGAIPGDLQLQWAQDTAEATDTEVRINSWLKGERFP